MPTQWFEEESDDDMARALSAAVDAIENSTAEQRRREWAKFDLELYTGEPIADLDDVVNVFRQRTPNDQDNSQIFNVTYSVLSTIESRVTSFRPRAQFLPNGADGKAKRAAFNMTALSDAWSDAVGYQEQAAQAFNDALTGDAGVLKTYEEDDTIKCDRFPSWEFLVSEADGKYGSPECLYHVRRILSSQAASMLGIDEEDFAQAGAWDSLAAMSGETGKVRVIEAWRRSPGVDEDGKTINGTHVILIGDKVIPDSGNFFKEDWEFDWFPVVIKSYRKAKQGMWGRSAISLHRSAQIELNEMQITAREAHRMSATKIVHVPVGEQAPTKVNNAYVMVDTYKTQPITVDTPPAWNPENYQYIEIIRNQIYEIHGVSKYQAVAQHRPGVDSGRALEEDSEQQSDRLAPLSQIWEQMRVDTARIWWKLTKRLAQRLEKEGRDSKPKWRYITQGTWKEMVFDDLEGEYEITTFPSSLFGHSVAGRFKKAEALIEKGWITREDALANLEVPDIMPTIDLILAEQRAMERIVDDVLEEGKLTKPDPLIPVDKMFNYARNRYLDCMAKKSATNAQLDLLRRLINSVAPKQTQRPAPAPTPPPAGPGTGPVPGPVPGGTPAVPGAAPVPAPANPNQPPPDAVPLGAAPLPMIQ